mmetsp:Transcript_25178/g.42481  ORF Transcript_25178/g.42481 Transcript_25178/m.42481 type:complete len:500 (+) Transcript_25178:118-1617(+)
MGGSNVKSLKDDDQQNHLNENTHNHDTEHTPGHNEEDIDDVVDFQMDGVVSKLQHKQLVTKVDVKGAIGREGDVINLRPDAEVLNDEEKDVQTFLAVELVRSQVQQYVLPPYITSEVQAKVPSQMIATVVKDLRLETKKSSVDSKEDGIRTSEATIAMDLMELTASPTSKKPRKSRGRAQEVTSITPAPKDEFTVKTFIEKYSMKGSEPIEPAVRSLNILVPFSDSVVSTSGTNLDSVRFRVNSPQQQEVERGDKDQKIASQRTTSLGMLSSRHRVKADNFEAAEALKNDALIRKLLTLHAQEVGLPVPKEKDSDSDDSDAEDVGEDKQTLYLSDDSSTEELYQKSLLEFSPVNSAVLLKAPGKSSKSKKRGPGYRLMNDDDFDDDDDDSDDNSDSDSDSDEESESDVDYTDSDAKGYTDRDDDSEDLSRNINQSDIEAEPLDAGVSMNMKDLLQFSCSCVDVRMLPNKNASVVLSDDEDEEEKPTRRKSKKKRSFDDW